MTILDYDAMLQAFYTQILRPGQVAIDAGAHIGRHSGPIAAALGRKGRVYAFEPLPRCCEALTHVQYKVAQAKGAPIEILPIALGNRDGSAEFVIALDATWLSGLCERNYDVPTRTQRMKVQVRKLDSLALRLKRLAYIKIDCEGGELDVLRGASGIIAKHRPAISFEFGADSIESYGITPRDMFDFHAARDYCLFDILGRALDAEQFIASAQHQEVWDYIALPQEQPEWARRLKAE